MLKYWYGFFTCSVVNAFLQDLLGKWKYLRLVDAAWIDTPAWIWPPFFLVVTGIVVWVEVKYETKGIRSR